MTTVFLQMEKQQKMTGSRSRTGVNKTAFGKRGEKRQFQEKVQFSGLENKEEVAHCKLRTNRKGVCLVINEPQTRHNKAQLMLGDSCLSQFIIGKEPLIGATVRFVSALLSHVCPQETPGDNALTILQLLML